MVTRKEIERLGFKVIAVTRHPERLSFDAHTTVGKRRLVKGDVEPTYDLAIASLFDRCAGLR